MSLSQGTGTDWPEIEFKDVLRQRVVRGEPVVFQYSDGPPSPRMREHAEQLLAELAAETGVPARSLEFIRLPEVFGSGATHG